MNVINVDKIDWALLREQKAVLLDIVFGGGHDLTVEQVDALDGVINMIDDLQDSACENLGEVVVFGDDAEYDCYASSDSVKL